MKRGQILWWTWTIIGAFIVIAFLATFSQPLLNVMNSSISQNNLNQITVTNPDGVTTKTLSTNVGAISGFIVPFLFVLLFLGIGALMLVKR